MIPLSFRFLLAGCALWTNASTTSRADHLALGVVTKDTALTLDVPFTYTGKAAAQLADIKTSCDCLRPAGGSTPLPLLVPGQTIKLPFTYRGAKSGRIAVTLLALGSAKDQVLATSTLTGFVTDPTWLVTPAALLAAAPDDERVFADTRPSERYEQAHLARSQNVPLFALKTRSDLRSKPVVLVDEGFAPELLLGEVVKLRALGFENVRVLSGGLIGWIRQGGKVEGSHTITPSEMAKMLPAEAVRAQATAPWQIMETHEPDAVVRALSEPATQSPLLIIADDDATYARIEARVAKQAGQRPVYYLAGGKPAWTAHRAEQVALAAHTSDVFHTKPITPMPITSGGCGSCGK